MAPRSAVWLASTRSMSKLDASIHARPRKSDRPSTFGANETT